MANREATAQMKEKPEGEGLVEGRGRGYFLSLGSGRWISVWLLYVLHCLIS